MSETVQQLIQKVRQTLFARVSLTSGYQNPFRLPTPLLLQCACEHGINIERGHAQDGLSHAGRQ